MNKELFADLVSAVHVTGNLVRIDLATAQPHQKNDNGQPIFEMSNRIIMPLEGFVQSLSVQENIVRQLIEAGILTQKPEPEKEAPSQEE